MTKNKNIRILHSVPASDNKFDKSRKLLFSIPGFENEFEPNGLKERENDIDSFDVIVIHYLRHDDIQFLIHHSISKPILWFSWGADIYILGEFYNRFNLKKTRRLRMRLGFKTSFIFGIKTCVLSMFPKSYDRKQHHIDRLKAIKSIDYIINVMPGEGDLLNKNYHFNIPSRHINLVDTSLAKENYAPLSGKNILIGNSASFTSNHIEAIDWILKMDLTNRKIIIPLNYGNDNLANAISVYAQKKLGDKVIILRDFIPFEEYLELMNSCEIVILNHLRQQAVGNVISGLLNGSNLYFRSESPVYQFLNDKGFHVQTIQNASSLFGLTEEEIQTNRKKAKAEFGKENQHKKLAQLIHSIVKD